MKKSSIYTRTGDEGKTGLVSGNRVSKADQRIDLYGELDELNSRLGFACSHLDSNYSLEINFIHKLQSALFDLGSNMACELENRSKFKLPQITEALVKEIESEIDRMDSQLEPLKNFILPGGLLSASAFHLARTNARKVERMLVSFEQSTKEELPEMSLIFLNRLSDYFFVFARYVNKIANAAEISWKPRS
ncbi:MAG: cob(I)yrinic acid a,c-diamide adenosyltransferase [Bdellovibrionales bacterium]|nr:cob(I)yrinic acid a,c-diamide adenosyltransferase [Bdellovibrionales bacterium]